MNNYLYPLGVNNFSVLDRTKIAIEMLRGKQYTMGKRCEEYEQEMKLLTGAKHAIFCSSGSAANHLLVETILQTSQCNKPPLIIVPACTWSTSITPWIMRGLEIKFCDINLTDFSFDYNQLKLIVSDNCETRNVIIFATALLGASPDIRALRKINMRYPCHIFLDSCEATLTEWDHENIVNYFDMATTSTFFSHLLVSIEGGFLFLKDDAQYQVAKSIKMHGMSRPIDGKKLDTLHLMNRNIDPRFLFCTIGSNFKNTDIHAYFGLLDIKRAEYKRKKRLKLARYFYDNLDPEKFYWVRNHLNGNVPFSLNVMVKGHKERRKILQKRLENQSVETRPIISGSLPIHPAFKPYVHPTESFPAAMKVHDHGFYIGLHEKLRMSDIKFFLSLLNK